MRLARTWSLRNCSSVLCEELLTLTAPTSPSTLADAASPLYISDQNAHVCSSPGSAKDIESSKCVESVSAGKTMAKNLVIIRESLPISISCYCASRCGLHIPEVRGNIPSLRLLFRQLHIQSSKRCTLKSKARWYRGVSRRA